MNFLCLLFYFFHVANRTLKVACVARVIFGEGQVDGEAGSLGISSYSEHGSLIPTGER